MSHFKAGRTLCEFWLVPEELAKTHKLGGPVSRHLPNISSIKKSTEPGKKLLAKKCLYLIWMGESVSSVLVYGQH